MLLIHVVLELLLQQCDVCVLVALLRLELLDDSSLLLNDIKLDSQKIQSGEILGKTYLNKYN